MKSENTVSFNVYVWVNEAIVNLMNSVIEDANLLQNKDKFDPEDWIKAIEYNQQLQELSLVLNYLQDGYKNNYEIEH